MIKNKKWFSLVEIIIGTVILAIASVWIVWIYTMLMDRDQDLDDSISVMYFNQYIFDLLNWIKIPELAINNNFYIKSNSDTNFEISQDPINNTDKINFCYDWDYCNIKHEIKLISIDEIEWIKYYTYKIYTNFNNHEKISYLTK